MTSSPSFKIERAALENGIVLLVNPRPESEAVSLRIFFRAGAVFDPPGRPGLSRFVAKMLIRGSETRTHRQIIREVESTGSTISFASGDELSSCSIRSTPRFLGKVMEIAFDCVRRPLFPESEVEKVRGILLTEIMEREDNTLSVAKRVARETLFPDGNPYHHDPGGYVDSIKAITREDIVDFWRRHFSPEHCIAAASGPVKLKDLRDSLDRLSRDWSEQTHAPQMPDCSPVLSERTRKIVPMPHKTQVDIVSVCPAVPRGHPDYYALSTANVILGQIGLMGRLGKAIRDRQGLAYYATSSYVAQIGTGYWVASVGVNPKNVRRALESLESEMTKMGRRLVTKSEYGDALTNQVGSLSLALETTGGAARIMQEIEIHGLGLDYLRRYPKLVRTVTREDIRRVSEQFINPERSVTAIVGPWSEREEA